MNKWALLAFSLLPVGPAPADQAGHPPAASNDPPIVITINPEARVSVSLGGAFPPPVRCGTPAVLSVKIVNQAGLTSRLEAKLVADVPAGTTLEFHPAPLTGVPQELRELHITLANPGLTDLTLAFRAHAEAADIGGRDRIHFLMRCSRGGLS